MSRGAELPGAAGSPLLTDLYQLTMVQSYLEWGMDGPAVFEFFVRRLPPDRSFLVSAGLAQALDFLEGFRFSAAELEWVKRSGRFSRDFVDYLAGVRFGGDVYAVPEGSVFFADEPTFRLHAPLPVAQLVESRIINALHFQTLVASKAARVVLAAPERLIVDFGLRRTHEAEGGLMAARAGYLAGLAGSSNVLAGAMFDIPVYGTMAHSYVQAHDDESEAFEHFARSHPGNVVLLIDTYDTERGAELVVELAPRLKEAGIHVRGVRLDSGDLGALAVSVRRILDAGGLSETMIFASGNLDEFRVRELVEAGAPIDGFGVGTRMNTSSDAPYLDCAYKLMAYDGVPRRKTSTGKAILPGAKQVYRRFDDNGKMAGDLLTTADDRAGDEPLLRPVMRAGRRLAAPSLEASREHAAAQRKALPDSLRALTGRGDYRVEISGALRDVAREVDARIARQLKG